MQCRKYDNAISRLIGFLLRSRRSACIAQIKALGLEGHAQDMASRRRQTIRR